MNDRIRLLGILGQHNRSSQQLKFAVVEKQQILCFFQSDARELVNLQIRQTTLLIL